MQSPCYLHKMRQIMLYSYANASRRAVTWKPGEKEIHTMAAAGGGAPMPSGYGGPPKIRFEVISEAWQLFNQQMKTWVLAILIFVLAIFIPEAVMGVLMMVSGGMGAMLGNHGGSAIALLGMGLSMIVGGLLIAVVVAVVMGGLFRMAIKQVRGEPIELSDLWSVTDVWMQLVLAGLLMGVAILVGSLACGVGAYIVGGLLMFMIPLIVDKKMTAMEAATLSWNTLKPEWLMAAVLYFVINFVAGIGGVLFGIGMLFTYPLLFLGIALTYRDFMLGGGGNAVPADPYAAPVAPGGYAPGGYTPGGYSPPTSTDEQR